MGYCDLLAKNIDDYVRVALRLGTDRRERSAASAAILESCGVLYDDQAIVAELEDFWVRAASEI